MKAKPASLEQIERWMQSVIMHPGGVQEGVDSPEARKHLDVTLEDLESVITRSESLASSERLEIYVDAYYERLLECLREEFPATRAAVSDELFHALAFGYLQQYPSRTYTLNGLGANFPRYLAESRLHAHETPSGAAPGWPDFVIELAEFERALREVFDGPGIERAATLNPSLLERTPPERRGAARLIPAPCLRLRRFEHPVHDYWAAVKEGQHPPAPGPAATHLAIHRRAYAVERHELSPFQFALLDGLVRGVCLAEAIRLAVETPGCEVERLQNDLPSWFAEWTGLGFFVGLELDPDERADGAG